MTCLYLLPLLLMAITMHDEFEAMHQALLEEFGRIVTIVYADGEEEQTRASFTKDRVMTGQLDTVGQDITLMAVNSALVLKRGDKIQDGSSHWEIDRKLKDNGYLAYWTVHEARY